MAGEPFFERGELADAADLARVVFDLATMVDLPQDQAEAVFRAAFRARFPGRSLDHMELALRRALAASHPLTLAPLTHAPGQLGDQPGFAWGQNGKQVVECDDAAWVAGFAGCESAGRRPSIRRQRVRLRA